MRAIDYIGSPSPDEFVRGLYGYRTLSPFHRYEPFPKVGEAERWARQERRRWEERARIVSWHIGDALREIRKEWR